MEWRRRHRRKLSWDDNNPAHVESGRLESFPVQGAFAFTPLAEGSGGARHELLGRLNWSHWKWQSPDLVKVRASS
jgi:hypothetical protein